MTERKYCIIPFTDIYLSADDIDIYACCSSCVKATGLIFDYSYEHFSKIATGFWFGDICDYYIDMRQSIIDGSYCMCDLDNCIYKSKMKTYDQLVEMSRTNPLIANIVEAINANDSRVFRTLPDFVQLAVDGSCNLKCKSCRSELSTSPKQKNINWNAVYEFLIPIKSIHIGGYGEAFFGSKFEAIMNFPIHRMSNLKHLEIMTNGTLVYKNYNRMPKELIDRISKICVSIDASTEKTYEKLRGAAEQFRDVHKSLDFLRENTTVDFELLFVLQNDNIDEAIDFFDYFEQRGFFDGRIKEIVYIPIDDWECMTSEEYDRVAVHKPSHPRHSKYIEVITKLTQLPRVAVLGNVNT